MRGNGYLDWADCRYGLGLGLVREIGLEGRRRRGRGRDHREFCNRTKKKSDATYRRPADETDDDDDSDVGLHRCCSLTRRMGKGLWGLVRVLGLLG